MKNLVLAVMESVSTHNEAQLAVYRAVKVPVPKTDYNEHEKWSMEQCEMVACSD